jgi:CubicO group peptidase (beta-lactamase class C family)
MRDMPRLKWLVLFGILLLAPVFAQQTASPPAKSADGVATDRLARIDRLLQQEVDDNRIAGAVALVLRDGRPLYDRAVGWSDKEAGRRMTTDTIFRIASQSKALTSVAALILMEEGALTLTTPVGRFIPTFAKTTVAVKGETGVTTIPARRAINIKDLLTHTAGISYGTDALVSELYREKGLGPAAGYGWYTADKEEPVCTTMERLGTLPFMAQPGESYVYGYNTDILGCVVERASGMPLDRFIATRITTPLGMKDTRFYLPAEQRARLSAVYSSGPEDKIVRAPDGARGQGHYIEGPRKSFSGGAGLLSTASDYARFLEMIRRGGALDGVRILAPRTVALMTTNQVGTLHSTTGLGFGLGFETTDRYGAQGLASLGSYRWGGAYGSTYLVDPDARLVLVFMMQTMPSRTDVATKFQNVVYQALIDTPRVRSEQ